jgi:hypothetical protein
MVEIYFNDCAESARKGIIMTELTLAGNGMVMPSNYVEIDREEMTYIEGGVYISNSILKGVICAIAVNPLPAVLIGLGVSKFISMMAAGIASIAARFAAINTILGVAIGITGIGAVLGMGYKVFDALVQRKGIDIGIKKTSWGMAYGLDVDVR